jgi:XTP/dITP diphosphohydrolase
MTRRFAGDRLVLATHNRGKVEEFAYLMRPRGVAVLAAADLGLAEPEETESTFLGNAVLKARAACAASGLPALADDSGLVVPALDGAPGIHSARWAGPERDFALAIERVLAALRERSIDPALAPPPAAFVAVLALAWPDGHLETVEGRCEGHLTAPPRGANAFGYDPIFVPAGETRTFAEMDAAEKHRHSHRGRAVRALLAACFATP